MLPGLTVRTTYRLAWATSRPSSAAHETEQRAFGQQLPHEPLPARAERGADGDFLLARRRAREQQVRDVGARDEQHERHRAQHHEHRAAHVADDRFDERHDVDREGPVALVLLANPRGDGGDVRVRLRHRHARLQARHEVVVLVAAAIHGIGAERERQEQVHLPVLADRRHDLGVQQEVGPEHADDLELVLRLARPGDQPLSVILLPTMLGSALNARFQKRVAEDDDGGFARDVVFVGSSSRP